MKPWPTVTLGDVCELKYGKSLPAGKRLPGSVPVYGSNGVVGEHDAAITSGPTIIVGRKGSFGEVHYASRACWPIDTTYFVDATCTDADLRWLSHLLRTLGLTELNRAAAIPGLNRDDAYRQTLLLPPLDEQRRIAAILDHADAIRTKRRAMAARLDALESSIYVHRFGRLASAARIDDVARPERGSIRTGPFGSQLLHSEFVQEGVAVLGLDNVVTNEFRWVGRRYVTPEKYERLKRYTVARGDVLISIMGTCGRCVVVPDDIPTAINTKHICAITVDRDKVLPEFVRATFLWHPDARRFLSRQTKGSIMDGLNMGIIKSVPVPVPPLAAQSRFVAIVREVGRRREVVLRAQSMDEELFASLRAEAFGGR